MLKDIVPPKVENVAVAIVKESGPDVDRDEVYNVYLINLSGKTLENVLVSSRGYQKNADSGNSIKTTTLRHSLKDIEVKDYKKVEPIMDDVLSLTNEYWVSFFYDGKMYDKKFVFVPESIIQDNFISVPLIEKKGVMID